MVNPKPFLLASATARSAPLPPAQIPVQSSSSSSLPWGVVSEIGSASSAHSIWTTIPRGGDPYEKDGKDDDKKQQHSKKKRSKGKKGKNKAGDDATTGKKDAPPPKNPQNDVVKEVLKCDDYYDVLGISKSATSNQIKKAYRKRCVHTHTDKPGGDRQAFDKVTEAYEVLSDESKRRIYDKYGKRGLDSSNPNSAAAGGAGNFADLFESMRRQQQEQQRRRQRQNPTLRYQLEVTLEDLYFGRTQNVSLNLSQYGNTKTVEVTIPQGSIHGEKIRLSGEIDFNESHPGDLIFVLTQRPHSTFTRKGHDLAIKVTIGLDEAMNGMQRRIRHLDGSMLTLVSAREEVASSSDDHDNNDVPPPPIPIANGDVHVLRGHGMPKRNAHNEFGDLYVQYRVQLPRLSSGSISRLSQEERLELGRLLAKLEGKSESTASLQKQQQQNNTKKKDNNANAPNTHIMKKSSVSDFGRKSGRVELEDDDDDDYYNSNDRMGSGFNPFGGSTFFSSSGGNGQSFFFGQGFGGSPGGGYSNNSGGNGDDGNMECSQM